MMQDNKKAARGATNTTDSKVETGPVSQTAPHLHLHDTTSPPPGQRVSALLSPGAAHAVPLRDLVALTGWSERDVRRQIERERRNGVPILSDSKSGYWLGEDPDEIAQFVRGMKHRAKQIQLTANAVGEAAGIE